ncbi:hypothetical protein Hanom_Chr16g01449421 [Helianthus anomalus]
MVNIIAIKYIFLLQREGSALDIHITYYITENSYVLYGFAALLRYYSQDRSTGKIRPGPREGRGGRSLKAHSPEGPRRFKKFIHFQIVYLIHTSAYHTIKCL